jgi:hypothetical protein
MRLRESLGIIVRLSILLPPETIATSFDSCDPCHAMDIDPETLPPWLEILEEEARQGERKMHFFSENAKISGQHNASFIRETFGLNPDMPAYRADND